LGLKGAFFKPIFFEYYSDKKAYEKIDESIMIGDALIIYPLFTDKTFDIYVYFPKGEWYAFPTGEKVEINSEEGGNIYLSGEFDHINIFMRGGYILPYQNTFIKFIPNSYQLHDEPTELIIIPNSNSYSAQGELIFDDDSIDTLENKNYYHIKIKFIYNSLFFSNEESMKVDYINKDIYLSKLKFLNMKYLIDEDKYDILIITYKNGKNSISALNYKNDFSLESDLSSLNAKFNEISIIKFGYLKYKSSYCLN
jgi:alpha-glucosidase (family GH31 glycosyl hydrolase)